MALRLVRFRAGPIPLQILVVVGPHAEYRALMARRYCHDSGRTEADAGSAQACCVLVRQEWLGAIWMPYFRRGNAFDAGKLAHEALHVAWRALEQLGIEDEETHAYILQWVVQTATERLTR